MNLVKIANIDRCGDINFGRVIDMAIIGFDSIFNLFQMSSVANRDELLRNESSKVIAKRASYNSA